MTDCFQRIVCRNLLNSKAILNKAVRRFPKNLLQKKRRNVYMNLHWKKAAALLLAGVLTVGTLSAFPAAAEDAVPSDTASAPTAAETVPEGSTEEASPEPTEPETDTNGDQIPIDKHTPDFYDALTDDTDDAGETESGLTSEEIPLQNDDATTREDSYSGTYGENISWTLDTQSGLLTLTGSGEIQDATAYYSSMPFYEYKDVIQEVVISDGITSIGDYIFCELEKLKTVTIPDSITQIGDRTFYGCESLQQVDLPNTITKMGYSIFDGCKALTSAHVPEQMTTLPYGTFWDCPQLTSVNLPEHLTEIGTYAFTNCSSLTSITLPETLETIREDAFNGCTMLESVQFGPNIHRVDEDAFSGTAMLNAIDADTIILGGYILYAIDGTETNFTVPDGVTVITASACKSALTSLDLNQTVYVGDAAFRNCTDLASVTGTDSLRSVGRSAFDGTAYLNAISDDLVMIGSCLYKYRGSAEDVVVPEGTVSISPECFSFNTDICSITLPDSLERIEYYAILGCESMVSLEIPESVTYIGDHAVGYYVSDYGDFYSISGFTIIGSTGSTAETYAATENFSFVANTANRFCGDELTWSLDAATGTLTISGIGAMYDYVSSHWSDDETTAVTPFLTYANQIRSVVVENGVTSIGENAFYGCNRLTSVSLPDTLYAINSNAFYGCSHLTDIQIPEGTESLSGSAFRNCNALRTLQFPASLTNCENVSYLYACNGLENFVVDADNPSYASVDGILYNKKKSSLLVVPSAWNQTVLTVPETVTQIASEAMDNNQKVQKVILPAGLTMIDSYSFYNCRSLKTMIFQGNAPSLYSTSCLGTNDLHIYAHLSSSSDWDSLKKLMDNSSYHVNWHDLNTFDNTLKLTAESTTLHVGENASVTAFLNPLLADDITWESSDPNTVVVSNTGRIIAVAPGSAEISASAGDGKYTDSIAVTVTGERFTMPTSGTLELDQTILNYTSISTTTMQIPSEKLHGIYFLQGSSLFFYSLVTQTYEQVYNFSDCTNAYTTGDMLYVVSQSRISVYDLQTQSLLRQIWVSGYSGTAIGADAQGRIYFAGYNTDKTSKYRIYLLSPEGDVLSQVDPSVKIYNFDGFESQNGTFYMESYYDYYSWGYHHPGKGLTMGKVEENKLYLLDSSNSFMESGLIQRDMDCLLYLCQDAYMNHQRSAEVLNDKYIVAQSVLVGMLYAYQFNGKSMDTVLSVSRPVEDDSSSYSDYNSIGVRTVYNAANDSLIVYANNNTLVEYRLKDGAELARNTTQNNVFNLLKMDDVVVVVEKENNTYSLEFMDWRSATELSISAEKTTLNAGDTETLTAVSDVSSSAKYIWKSSDSSVVSVNENGTISAWHEGTAEITCTSKNGLLSATITITVLPHTKSAADGIKTTTGASSINLSANNYSVWSSTVNSYLTKNEDGTLTRGEHIRNKGFVIEHYSADFQLLDSQTISDELKLFGGYYSGSDYNFLVYGQSNPDNDDSVEIMRVVKYSKNWEKLDSKSIYGENTYIPFDAGSLRMTETAGKLYIHTCHEMYTSSDGLNHQANMTFVLDENTLKVLDSYSDVMNLAQAGYVSHSFNQFICTDGKSVYRVDHGDANPRAVAITKCDVDGKITDVRYNYAYSILGGIGDNATGVSVGGFALSKQNCIIAGNSVDMTDENNYSASGQRNVFVTILSKDLDVKSTIFLTKHTEKDGISVRTPQLVALNEEQFLVMWEEVDSEHNITVKAVTINSEGTATSKVETLNYRLSDCQPIFNTSNQCVQWYASNNTALTFYTLDPYGLSENNTLETLYGDVNLDGEIDITDCVLLNKCLTGAVKLNKTAKRNADVDQNNEIDTSDTIYLLQFLIRVIDTLPVSK